MTSLPLGAKMARVRYLPPDTAGTAGRGTGQGMGNGAGNRPLAARGASQAWYRVPPA